jgi:hypothetical protein
MGTLRELLAVDHRQTLEFFFIGLKDVSEDDVSRQELLYNASVLAHYAQVSTEGGAEFPTPASLESVFDHFVADAALRRDAGMLETAGTHCLLMAGFFEAQMRHRHNVRWYADLGAAFFFRAAVLEPSPAKALLMDTMGRGFEPWRQRYARLSHELREQPYLLALPAPSRPM